MRTDEIHDLLQRESYAREHGYIVKDCRGGWHYVYRQGRTLPLADYLSHWEAVRLAYDLAKDYPDAKW